MKILSFTTISLISSLTLISLAQDCNNPLLSFFNLTPLSSPQSGANLPYCAHLQSGQTCCSADTVASFQDKLNGLINNLNNYAAGRDLYLSQLRNSYLNRFNTMLQDINTNHQDLLQALSLLNPSIASQLQAIIGNATQIANDARNINNQFDANLSAYQKARSDCLTTALEVQGSAWCLACDPNYANEGVDDNGDVTFAEGLCQAISNACAPYFNQSADFNPLFTARKAYWNLIAVSNYLKNFTTANGALNNFTIAPDPYNPLPSQLPASVPAKWVGNGDASSPALCQNLWSGDGLLGSLLNIGAGEPNAISGNNVEVVIGEEEGVIIPIEEVSVGDNEGEVQVTVNVDGTVNGEEINVEHVVDSGTRLLQDVVDVDAGVWAPDLTATGLDFSGLRQDPGDYFGVNGV